MTIGATTATAMPLGGRPRPMPRQLNVSDWNVDADVRSGRSSAYVRGRERATSPLREPYRTNRVDNSAVSTSSSSVYRRGLDPTTRAPSAIRPSNRYDSFGGSETSGGVRGWGDPRPSPSLGPRMAREEHVRVPSTVTTITAIADTDDRHDVSNASRRVTMSPRRLQPRFSEEAEHSEVARTTREYSRIPSTTTYLNTIEQARGPRRFTSLIAMPDRTATPSEPRTTSSTLLSPRGLPDRLYRTPERRSTSASTYGDRRRPSDSELSSFVPSSVLDTPSTVTSSLDEYSPYSTPIRAMSREFRSLHTRRRETTSSSSRVTDPTGGSSVLNSTVATTTNPSTAPTEETNLSTVTTGRDDIPPSQVNLVGSDERSTSSRVGSPHSIVGDSNATEPEHADNDNDTIGTPSTRGISDAAHTVSNGFQMLSPKEQRERLYTFRRDMRQIFARVDEMVDMHRDLFKLDPVSGAPQTNLAQAAEVAAFASQTWEYLTSLRNRYMELASAWQDPIETPPDLHRPSHVSSTSRDLRQAFDEARNEQSSSVTESDAEASTSDTNSTRRGSTTSIDTLPAPQPIRSTAWQPTLSAVSSESCRSISPSSPTERPTSSPISSRSSCSSPRPPLPPRPRRANITRRSQQQENTFEDFDRRMEEIRASLNALTRQRDYQRGSGRENDPHRGNRLELPISASAIPSTTMSSDSGVKPDRETRLRELLAELSVETNGSRSHDTDKGCRFRDRN